MTLLQEVFILLSVIAVLGIWKIAFAVARIEYRVWPHQSGPNNNYTDHIE